MRIRVLGPIMMGIASLAGAVVLMDCEDSSNSSSGGINYDGGQLPDANVGPGPQNDGAIPESDASLDGGADADASYGFDDAGCPLTGPTLPLGNADFPTNGLRLWLRADHGAATVDGGSVCRWDDQSGNNYAFRPVGTAPPTLVPGSIKGHPSVSFVGNNEMFRNDVLGIDPESGRTMAVYAQTVDTARRFHYFFQGFGGSAGQYVGFDQNTYQTAFNLEGVYVANNSFDSNVATATTPRSQILSISSLVVGTSLPGALVYRVDGADATLTLKAGGGTVQSFADANFTSLGGLDFVGEPWAGGFLGEVLVWNRALDATERAQVEAHFAASFPNP